MARKDQIFRTFMAHPLLNEKHSVQEMDLPKSVIEGLQSDVPVIKTIALIVSNLESPTPVNDNSLRAIVTTYLNSAII